MSNLGSMAVSLLNVRVAGTPIFIPGADPKRHHTMITVICNRGKNRNTQEEMSDAITCNFWDKYAQTAANFIDKGRELNILGELRSYPHQTGQIRSDGKPAIERRVEVLVNRFFFGKDSMKETSARVNAVIATLKQTGRLPMDANITAEELLAITRPQAVDYNPTLHANGIYGNARVWTKGTGFTGNGVVASAGAMVVTNPAGAQNVANPTNVPGANVNELAAQIAALQASMNDVKTAGTVNPFPVA